MKSTNHFFLILYTFIDVACYNLEGRRILKCIIIAENIDDLKDFNYEFSTIVDTVSVELIGEHEESIVIKNIKSGGV